MADSCCLTPCPSRDIYRQLIILKSQYDRSFWEGNMLAAHSNQLSVTRAALALIIAGGLAGIGTASASAQTIRGTLTGTVTDSTGAVLPGATVTVTNRDTGIETSTQTGLDGNYTFSLLQPGV